ncbi:hypothetical protein BWZ20_05510 [Winogradskyella sp. J14-2]|uniref:hypothetical protein n=1 Tax=Winogradskyella sp. J14-2 TaxID=1936080 RepID=UPI0009728FEB|nr:hypothetical protein [Winogradskyella sp. J14-2]APY07787.1 hypothetical protein BWZ20_05510 [Winogradskyella sp. J14-2]
MKKQPIEVRLVSKKGNAYLIKFPNLEIPVKVNEHLYYKMLHSPEYQFRFSNAVAKQPHLA